jgi:hypothetical protein
MLNEEIDVLLIRGKWTQSFLIVPCISNYGTLKLLAHDVCEFDESAFNKC